MLLSIEAHFIVAPRSVGLVQLDHKRAMSLPSAAAAAAICTAPALATAAAAAADRRGLGSRLGKQSWHQAKLGSSFSLCLPACPG